MVSERPLVRVAVWPRSFFAPVTYLSCEHEVLERFPLDLFLTPMLPCSRVSIDLGQIQRRVSSVVVRPDTV